MEAVMEIVSGGQSGDETLYRVERDLGSQTIALAEEASRRNRGAVIRMEQVRK